MLTIKICKRGKSETKLFRDKIVSIVGDLETDAVFATRCRTAERAFVRPKLIESRASMNDQFFRLTDGFKKVFTNDSKDCTMVIPISGYAGHRRGNKSQNFFGKSFREHSMQSKQLERQLHGKEN
jgi:hypothetical protein